MSLDQKRRLAESADRTSAVVSESVSMTTWGVESKRGAKTMMLTASAKNPKTAIGSHNQSDGYSCTQKMPCMQPAIPGVGVPSLEASEEKNLEAPIGALKCSLGRA